MALHILYGDDHTKIFEHRKELLDGQNVERVDSGDYAQIKMNASTQPLFTEQRAYDIRLDTIDEKWAELADIETATVVITTPKLKNPATWDKHQNITTHKHVVNKTKKGVTEQTAEAAAKTGVNITQVRAQLTDIGDINTIRNLLTQAKTAGITTLTPRALTMMHKTGKTDHKPWDVTTQIERNNPHKAVEIAETLEPHQLLGWFNTWVTNIENPSKTSKWQQQNYLKLHNRLGKTKTLQLRILTGQTADMLRTNQHRNAIKWYIHQTASLLSQQ